MFFIRCIIYNIINFSFLYVNIDIIWIFLSFPFHDFDDKLTKLKLKSKNNLKENLISNLLQSQKDFDNTKFNRVLNKKKLRKITKNMNLIELCNVSTLKTKFKKLKKHCKEKKLNNVKNVQKIWKWNINFFTQCQKKK